MPLLYLAAAVSGSDVIVSAGLITLLLFTGLTFIVLTTKKDFSFLGGFLKIAFFVALGIIGASILFGFSLGVLFASVMVIVVAALILYNTSNVLHRYHPSQYVAASLTLFASIALLFWYTPSGSLWVDRAAAKLRSDPQLSRHQDRLCI